MASPTIEKESFFECNHIRKKFWASYSSQDLDFFFLRQPANGRPSLGHQILRSKFQTFLKVFEKNDGKVILMSTNIIMGQLNIKDYEYDNGITIFWLCENLRTHFHLRLFDPWYDSSDLEALSNRFEVQREMSACADFTEDLDASNFACLRIGPLK